MAAKYWRLSWSRGSTNNVNNGGNLRYCLVALEMRETQGGANAATGGTPTASSQASGRGAAFALDTFASGNYWRSANNQGGETFWWRYEFTSDVEIEEVTITGKTDGSAVTPRRFALESSPDGTNWTTKYVWTLETPWVTDGSDVREFNGDNADTDQLFNWKMHVVSLVNYPAEEVRNTAIQVKTVFRQMATVQLPQLRVVSLVRGRVAHPEVKAWPFDLDSHEFYILRLGDEKTLAYDRSTGTWSWWTSGNLPFWRPSIGTNWTDYGTIAHTHGSGVVVGDDTYGILWVLNPDQGYDDPTSDREREEGEVKAFPRVATGQVLTRGRVTVPCYQTYLVADTGTPAYTGASVTLSYSDDGGKTFVDAGTIEVEAGNYYQEFAWRSLGLIRSPGRLFRISDDGAFPQIDELTLYDDPTS